MATNTQTLHRWAHITMVGFGQVQLLSYSNDQEVDELCRHSPWWKQNSRAAGQSLKTCRYVKTGCRQAVVECEIQEINANQLWQK